MIKKAALFILWFVVWLALTWPADVKQCVLGIIISLFVTLMTVDIFKLADGTTKTSAAEKPGVMNMPKRIFWLVCYAMVFLWECLKATTDVVWRVACPVLPIRPATIRVKTDLKSDIGLTFLANSITFTPGATTVDIDKERGYIYIHMLFLKESQASTDIKLPVVDKYGRILKRIFE
ncbi:MAG: Na+/H+ antiporter subunit E [Candidatus Omnitrophica bacterium]|nr:Na+/H+ antiporter subunit E [Candidatus Omnitrophota bacterium]